MNAGNAVSLALVLLPAFMAAVTFILMSTPRFGVGVASVGPGFVVPRISLRVHLRVWFVPLTGALHLALTALALTLPDVSSFNGWLTLDRLGSVVLGLTSLIFFIASLYVPGYLAARVERRNGLFVTGLLGFLSMTSLMIQSHHLGLMWVAMETLTISCAPLVYFNQNPRSLEATWKYVLIGSIGIALALFGSFFLAYSAFAAGLESSLHFDNLVKEAPQLSRPWLHSAFILLFVGYGTKMGLAPMHTWKPDAYGEASGVVGALLAGCVTSCAFLAILRFFQICSAAGEADFARRIMVVAGLFSMLVAAVFLTRQRDLKRMLAYSSVEHMGILVLGIGVGGPAVFGSLLHLVANAITKGSLFLAAGNIQRAYGAKTSDVVTGAIRRAPASAALLLVGFFAVTGTPPFAVFVSELTIIRAAVAREQIGVAVAFLVFLAIAFTGMASTVLGMVNGTPAEAEQPVANPEHRLSEGLLTVGPIAAFLLLSLLLGTYIPAPIEDALREAARALGAT